MQPPTLFMYTGTGKRHTTLALWLSPIIINMPLPRRVSGSTTPLWPPAKVLGSLGAAHSIVAEEDITQQRFCSDTMDVRT